MKAVIFNLEGTLLDVREAFYNQYETVTAEFDGTPASRDAIAATAHGTPGQALRQLVSTTQVPFETIQQRHQAVRAAAYEAHVRPHAAAHELLPLLKRLGVRVAALSHGDAETVAALERSGLKEYFDVIVTSDDLPRLMPHAEGVQQVLVALRTTPEETVLVGDGVNNILAGKNAGLAKTIGISHGFGSIEALRAAGADAVVHDIPSILDMVE